MRDSKTYDVVIAGAGPVGLFLACELRLAGATVLVLERADNPDTPLKRPPFGMRGLSAPTIEAFYRRGLLDDIAQHQPAPDPAGAASVPIPHGMQQGRRPGGHFAGIPFSLDKVEPLRWRYRLPGPAGTHMATTMARIETVLSARARAMGAEIRRGLAIEGFAQSSDELNVRAGGETFNGRWLVGCDGGRSMVRKLAGFEFIGTDAEFTGYSVEVVLAAPEKLAAGRRYTPTGMYTYQAPGTIAMVDFDGGALHRTGPITLAHVQSVLRRVSGTEVTVADLRLATTWTDRSCQATRYRSGRVLLAGDAAHIHSPLGGQGLNLGLGDAMNLGWKLASVIRGHAPDSLLDTYFEERHPVASQVLDGSRAQVALMRPSRSTRALEAIVRDLMDTPDGATYFAERVWGLSLRYELGGAHPLVGRSAPDFEFSDGTRLGAYLKGGKGLLLDFAADATLAACASGWPARIEYLACRPRDALGLTALLLRPDGIVAWVSEATPDAGEAAQAAARWFGEASRWAARGVRR
ncbi:MULTISPECIES: FAD-dependent monooxygenase [unclassified Variovorax]|uniref:FAD-dependent monooxygenase n=1 Tax=unclassified Variovorax TaxID=663243 RepID=UPI0025789102|nr:MULTISPECIES: FAD-dependent monooxygenase [unclassified Variovorax]MDM0086991.1 FAD-dependent monooxygenase [Variovorax sp. J22G40]MDM0144752.1 FAD-dependent monooxygenase [Variovorax sp. J2P1-31]